MTEKKTVAERLFAVAEACLFPNVEAAEKYQSEGGVFVPGLGPMGGFNFRSDKLEEHKEDIRLLAKEIVPDELILEEGSEEEGRSWLVLQHDRNGAEWGSPDHANALIALCNAVNLQSYCHDWTPAMMNHPLTQMMGMPFIRFSPSIRE